MGELQHLTVDAADIWFKTDLLERLEGLETEREVFDVTQIELSLRLRCDADLLRKLELLRHAIDRLSMGKQRRMSEVALDLGIHRRSLERLFWEHVGISPGSYARIHRITKAARLIGGPNGPNALDFALDHGFYDQAHFNRDFKEIVGLSPSEYRKSQGFA